MSKADDFKAELKDLLDKYDASIGFTVGTGAAGDGVCNGLLDVSFTVKKPKPRSRFVDERR